MSLAHFEAETHIFGYKITGLLFEHNWVVIRTSYLTYNTKKEMVRVRKSFDFLMG